MGDLPALELMRVAVNRLTHVPASFCRLDRLAWFSLAGNHACPAAPKRALEFVRAEELEMGPLLGDGASGEGGGGEGGRDVQRGAFRFTKSHHVVRSSM